MSASKIKCRLLSDLHTEGAGYLITDNIGDKDTICILAGDVGTFASEIKLRAVLEQANEKFAHTIYVAGNHEFYHSEYFSVLKRLQLLSNEFENVHFLHNDTFEYNGVKFIGTTLWSDCDKGNPLAALQIQRAINDYRYIQINTAEGKRLLTPADTMEFHQAALEFLDRELQDCNDTDKQAVVVTHFVPSKSSTHSRFLGDIINGAFASSLEDKFIFKHNPQIWCHGHTHDCYDYKLHATRMICNPRGYQFEQRVGNFLNLKTFNVNIN